MTHEQDKTDQMSTKKQRRLENKKRKTAAFLELAQLNDEEGRTAKQKKVKKENEVDEKKKEEIESSTKTPGAPPRLTSKPLLSGVEYEELRAKLRARKKAFQLLPKFELKSTGFDASIENTESTRTPLFMQDLQHLLMYLMVGDKAPYEPFRLVYNFTLMFVSSPSMT